MPFSGLGAGLSLISAHGTGETACRVPCGAGPADQVDLVGVSMIGVRAAEVAGPASCQPGLIRSGAAGSVLVGQDRARAPVTEAWPSGLRPVRAEAAHEPEDLLALLRCQQPGITGGRKPGRRAVVEVADDLPVDEERVQRVLAGARRIPLRGPVWWAGYLTARTGAGVIEGPNRTSLVLVDVASGRIISPLTTLPEALSAANASDGPEGTVQTEPPGHLSPDLRYRDDGAPAGFGLVTLTHFQPCHSSTSAWMFTNPTAKQLTDVAQDTPGRVESAPSGRDAVGVTALAERWNGTKWSIEP
jgi:hypothetical protein